MKNKDKLKKLLSQAKSFNADKKAQEEKRLAEEKSIAQALNQINNTNKEIKMKKLSKQVKHDLALIKMIGQMKAAESKTAMTQEDFSAMLNEYVEEKGIELTTDHSNILRTTQSSDMIFSFDEKSEAGAILALFNRYDLPVNGTVTVPVDNQSVELQHLAETAAVTEQTWDESVLTLTSSRSALAFKLSRSLQFKSIVDQMAYVERIMTTAVAKGLVEGIINGQGATSAVQDNGYSSSKMGSKMAGIRAKLAAASFVSDALKKDLDATDGKAVLQQMFDAAGARFSRSQAGYVILANRAQKLKISELVKGAGVTGVNTAAASQVYATSYQGVPVIECAFLISNTTVSGSGVSHTGFVSATAADNDHSSLILLDPSQVWYHIGGERVDVEYKSSTDSFEVTLNCQAGWNMLCDSRNQPGVFLVNIGADIA